MVVAVISFYVIILKKVIPPPATVYVRNKKFYLYLETRAIFSNQRTGVGLGTARRRTVDLNPWII